ncbi:MAG: hypothetical protein ACHP84_15305 [Caulobacterales bacterium]
MRGAVFALVLLMPPGLAAAQPTPPPEMSPEDAYDARVRASMAAAEAMQGPLDGRWLVVTAEGRVLFMFQLVDPSVTGPLEGVFRDLRRAARPSDIGAIDELTRTPATLHVTFRGLAGPVVLDLKTGANGFWSGSMTEAGATTAVSLRR